MRFELVEDTLNFKVVKAITANATTVKNRIITMFELKKA